MFLKFVLPVFSAIGIFFADNYYPDIRPKVRTKVIEMKDDLTFNW